MALDSPFDLDDYDQINETYFKNLREGDRPAADPSGWLDARSDAEGMLPEIALDPRRLSPYYIDEDRALGETKDRILRLISAWEDRSVSTDEITLCHSVSTCTLVTMSVMKSLGVGTILFETPAYSVTISQARHLGLRDVLVPTYHHEGFQFPITADLIRRHSPCAVWITQPRMSLGVDQPPAAVEEIAKMLSPKDFLVIDEATEQRFPSVLRRLDGLDAAPNILRLRGILKGVGLNGLRTAFILHHPLMRRPIQSGQEFAGGSLDVYSLMIVAALSDDIDRFRNMLAVANKQVAELRARADRIAYGTRVQISRLVNGYIGCLFISGMDGAYDAKRRRFIEGCRDRRMPVILGASMQFARDPNFLQVRLNYFNGENNILNGVSHIVDLATAL